MNSPDLTFTIESAGLLRFSAAPHIVFKLCVTNDSPQAIHTIILRIQVQIEVSRRRYNADEQRRLSDLFGPPAQWGETLRSMLWANTSIVVPSFEQSTAVDLQLPCTFDFNAAATKYFSGIEGGEVPVSFYFNGTIFYSSEDGVLRAAHISWDKEASYRMPVQVWRELIDSYYPNTVWLSLHRDVFDRLYEYKVRHGLPTFEEALMNILDSKVEARTA
jgi:hypothetical protein